MHPYFAFDGQSNVDDSQLGGQWPHQACSADRKSLDSSRSTFGMTITGELSNAINDCGLFVNGVNLGTRYEGNYTGGPWPMVGSCEPWTDWTTWNDTMKADIQQYALASMSALQVREVQP